MNFQHLEMLDWIVLGAWVIILTIWGVLMVRSAIKDKRKKK